MPDTVISVENLSKHYPSTALRTSRLGVIGSNTLRDDVDRLWARLRGQHNPLLKLGQSDHTHGDGETLWALRDVSFEVQRGEVVGIPSTGSGQASGATAPARARCLRFSPASPPPPAAT